ncbi:MAG: hypothetical protein SGPRY_014824, partial [Prymnesium sp.]
MEGKLPLAALVTLSVLLVEHCTTVALTRLTQQRAPPRPLPTLSVLLTELFKLALATALQLSDAGGLGSGSSCAEMRKALFARRGADTLRLSLPALLYTLQNNLIYVALAHIEMVTFQVLYQSKLLLTALLSVACLGKELRKVQWASLLLLTLGVICLGSGEGFYAAGRQLAQGSQRSDVNEPTHRESPYTTSFGIGRASVGAGAAFVAATLSSLAGVYFESVVKSTEANAPSLWLRNVQLCIFTIPVATVGVALQKDKIAEEGLWSGFDACAWILISLNSAGGLLIAAVIKYGDNILKNFTTSCSVILGTVLSMLFFNFSPSMRFFIGAALVILATYIYAAGPHQIDTRFGQRATSTSSEYMRELPNEEDESMPLRTEKADL